MLDMAESLCMSSSGSCWYKTPMRPFSSSQPCAGCNSLMYLACCEWKMILHVAPSNENHLQMFWPNENKSSWHLSSIVPVTSDVRAAPWNVSHSFSKFSLSKSSALVEHTRIITLPNPFLRKPSISSPPNCLVGRKLNTNSGQWNPILLIPPQKSHSLNLFNVVLAALAAFVITSHSPCIFFEDAPGRGLIGSHYLLQINNLEQ